MNTILEDAEEVFPGVYLANKRTEHQWDFDIVIGRLPYMGSVRTPSRKKAIEHVEALGRKRADKYAEKHGLTEAREKYPYWFPE